VNPRIVYSFGFRFSVHWQNRGGNGRFVKDLEGKGYSNITAFEIDGGVANDCDTQFRFEDFLFAEINQRFRLSIGNPPYIRRKNMDEKLQAIMTRFVKEYGFVLSIVDNVNELFWKQSRVNGVTHHPATRDAKITFQVPHVIPTNGRAPIPLDIACRSKRRRKLSRPPRNSCPVRSTGISIRSYRHNLSVSMVASSMVDQRIHGEFYVHHFAKHVYLLSISTARGTE